LPFVKPATCFPFTSGAPWFDQTGGLGHEGRRLIMSGKAKPPTLAYPETHETTPKLRRFVMFRNGKMTMLEFKEEVPLTCWIERSRVSLPNRC